MLKNYFITAIRSFKRNKLFTLINILGLAIGISSALVIYLVVQFDFSYEKFRKDLNRTYRVVSDMTFPGNSVFKNGGVPMPMAKAVREDLTGIEIATHFVTTYGIKATVPVAGSQSPATFKKQDHVVYADEYYFSLFEYDWLAGSKQTALSDPYQVVLTEERVKTYFGNLSPENVLGKQIIYNDTITTTVSGVIKDPVHKATDIRFKEFISLETLVSTGLNENFGGNEWGSITSNSQLFVKLNKGTKAVDIEPQFKGLREKYLKKEDKERDDTKHHLQAFKDIHFTSDYDALDERQGHKPTLYGLIAVAIFLLLLGCINFINLTTAQSSQRAKEIGIRKTLGGNKKGITLQFLSETFLLTFSATVLSIAIMPWLLKIFSDFIPPEISFASVNQVHVWVFLALLVMVMTLLAGFYPSIVLTRFRPVTALKNQMHSNTSQSRKSWLRKSLTVTQFVIAQFLVIATLIVSKQIRYSLNKDLGYKKDAIVYINTPWNFFSDKKDDRRFALIEKIKAIPAVEKAGLGSYSPAHGGSSSSTFKVNTGKEEVELMVETVNADQEYYKIYGLKLAAGKYPDKSDTIKEYLINESYAKSLGFQHPEDALNLTISRRNRQIPIVGVLADFHTKSTHEPIKPLIYSSDINQCYTIHIALQPQDNSPGLWKSTIAKIEKEFKKLYPENDFTYNFYDETIAAFYKKEQDISRLLTWSAGLCIFISCMGLLGLVIYTTNTRIKEIGVRKVLGASVLQIVRLLSGDLLSLVLVAFIIASPIAWIAMNYWLQDFVYRTTISWWVFAACGISMLMIALLVLSIRTIKAANENPITSLRTE